MALSLSYRENWNFGNQCKSTDNVDLKKTKLGFTYKKKHKQKKKNKNKDLQMGIWTQTL